MESIAMLYIDFSLLLQNSVGHRNHPLNHFGSFVLWMSGYYGGRCSRPFKNHRPQSRTTDRTCPYLAESVFRAISDHSVSKRAYLAHCDLTFVVLLVLLKKGCLKALTTFARTSQILFQARWSLRTMTLSQIDRSDDGLNGVHKSPTFWNIDNL